MANYYAGEILTDERMSEIRRSEAYKKGWEDHRKWMENGRNWPAGMKNCSSYPIGYSLRQVDDWTKASFSATDQVYGSWPALLAPIYENAYAPQQLDLFGD